MRSIRTERWKYIRYFDKNALIEVPADCAGGATQRALGPQFRIGMEALFDLAADPDEQCNLASEETYASIKQSLQQQLLNESKQQMTRSCKDQW